MVKMNNNFSIKNALRKCFDMCKVYITDLNSSWMRRSVFIQNCKYVLLIILLVVICWLLPDFDKGILTGVSTGIAATFAVKICDCNHDLHIAFRRTKLIAEDFIWNYENAKLLGLNDREVEHKLRNLYYDMILEASKLSYSYDYAQLAAGMSIVVGCICSNASQDVDEKREKAFATVKKEFNILFEGR